MDSTDAKTAFANSAKITKVVEDAIKELNLPTVTTPSIEYCVDTAPSDTTTPARPTSSGYCIIASDTVTTTSPTTSTSTSSSTSTITTTTLPTITTTTNSDYRSSTNINSNSTYTKDPVFTLLSLNKSSCNIGDTII